MRRWDNLFADLQTAEPDDRFKLCNVIYGFAMTCIPAPMRDWNHLFNFAITTRTISGHTSNVIFFCGRNKWRQIHNKKCLFPNFIPQASRDGEGLHNKKHGLEVVNSKQESIDKGRCLIIIRGDLCKTIFRSPWTRFRVSKHIDFIRCWNKFSMTWHSILWLLQKSHFACTPNDLMTIIPKEEEKE